MKLDRTQSAIIAAIGVAALNVVYLWDMFLDKQEGLISIGMLAWGGIVIANIVIIGLLVKMAGREDGS